MMCHIEANVKGRTPLVMSNPRILSDPLNSICQDYKAIMSQRKKTMEDYEKLSKYEWKYQWYIDNNGRVVIPSYLIMGVIKEAAKSVRALTTKVKKAMIFNTSDLVHGPSHIDSIENLDVEKYKVRLMAVNRKIGAVVHHTCPKIDKWAFNLTGMYDDELVSSTEVKNLFSYASRFCCFGTNRPINGRFEISKLKC